MAADDEDDDDYDNDPWDMDGSSSMLKNKKVDKSAEQPKALGAGAP